MELNHVDVLLAQNKMIAKQLADLTKQMEKNQVTAVTTQSSTQEGVNTEEGEAIEQMPLYTKFLKELMTKKRSWRNNETVVLTEECSAIIQHKLPQKLKDPGSFQIPCIIGEIKVEKALCDLGASLNLMSSIMMKRMKIEKAKPTRMALQLADRSFKFPQGIVEDLLVKVGDFIFPADFVVLDMEEEAKASIILGRPFLATARAIIDVQKGELTLRLHDKNMIFNVFKAMSYPQDSLGECIRLDSMEAILQETLEEEEIEELTEEDESTLSKEVATVEVHDQGTLEGKNEEKEAPKLKLKELPPTLKYAYLGENRSFPVIINSALSQEQEEELLQVLQKHKDAIGWTLADLKGISSAICMHKILLEDDSKASIQPQRRLNPAMKEVVQKEVMKLWQAGVIYPIFDSPWAHVICAMQCARNLSALHAFYLLRYEGIVLGHKVSKQGIEVDRAKVELIEKLPPPSDVKGCMLAFENLKKKLSSAPIIAPPDWNLPFELMCDASDFAVGAMLGQRKDNLVHVIYYASKEFNIEIRDKKGVENKVADHLSRIPCEKSSTHEASVNEFFLDE
ncbi:uncharacterized protein LOC110275718 [Arachis duranensis]|uniref:Uncharacterized protein LOC110275718 n=1 Tax=Arachis duranensis TaxID=130453 RepID=A0A6P5MXQ3_ARADU|nr:uncharacterized protein LOC110275718 [Arachis duranensis]